MGDGFTGQKTQPTVSKYWRNNSAQSDAHSWASECLDVKNYKWRLNPVWHRILYSCNHKATVDVKGLKIGRITKLNYGSHHARLSVRLLGKCSELVRSSSVTNKKHTELACLVFMTSDTSLCAIYLSWTSLPRNWGLKSWPRHLRAKVLFLTFRFISKGHKLQLKHWWVLWWESIRMSLTIWHHTMLLATWHKRTHSALTPASEDWYSNYHGRMEGWVDLNDLIVPRPAL